MEAETVSGKQLTLTVAYRLPWTVYRKAQEQAEAEGVRLSVVLRRATERGLAAEVERCPKR